MRIVPTILLLALLTPAVGAAEPDASWRAAAGLPDLAAIGQPAPAALLGQRLAGRWQGSLLYRDFGTDRGVTLPTDVAISGASAALQLAFTYDDGPGKTVRSNEQWSLAGNGTTFGTGKSAAPMAVSLYRGNGDGDLALVAIGEGVENDVQVAVRMVVLRRGTSLHISRSTRLPDGVWLLRHVYRLALVQ